jgi:biopolymer transport protein ExbB
MFSPMPDLTVMERGGPILWVLLILSAVGFVVFVERTFFLHRGQIRASAFIDGIRNLVGKQRLVEALTLCEETPGPTARVVRAALLHHDRPAPELRMAVQEAAVVEIPFLERRIGTIGVIARVAPLVGLLGTLAAILEGFFRLQAEGPYADSGDYAGLFGQALLTTVAGVAIAAVAQAAYHFLNGRVRALIHDMEWAGHRMIQLLTTGEPVGEADTGPSRNTDDA